MKPIRRCNWVNIEFKGERFKVRAELRHATDVFYDYLVRVEMESLDRPKDHKDYGRMVETKASGLHEALEKFGRMVDKIKNSPDRFEYL